MVRKRRPILNPSEIIEAIRRFRTEVLIGRISSKVPPTHAQYRKAQEADVALRGLADELSGGEDTLSVDPHTNPIVTVDAKSDDLEASRD